jgi:dTDP-4-amino-4,6-dideoxygalactose transaminase
LPSDIIAAFLFAQLENLDKIQSKRISIWNLYYEKLKHLSDKKHFKLLETNENQTNNGHLFAIIMNNIQDRSELIDFMKSKGIMSVFHYQSLHVSEFYFKKHDGRILINSDDYSNTLLRLPLYYEMRKSDINRIISVINEFYNL